MSYTAEHFAAFLAPVDSEADFREAQRFEDMPHKQVIVSRGSGSRLRMEGIVADLPFTVRARGNPDDYDSALKLAEAIATQVLHADVPFVTADDVRAIAMTPRRLPALEQTSPDTARRYTFVAQYVVTANTDI